MQDDSEPPSKSQRKRASTALQDLGTELTKLSVEQIESLDLPEPLLGAILEAKRINKFGALRRQRQYIGRVMRDIDAEPIAAKLETLRGTSREASAQLHLLERWRTRLLEDDSALAELALAYPACDTQHFRQLIRNAQREHAAGKPPASFRALFRELKQLMGAEDS